MDITEVRSGASLVVCPQGRLDSMNAPMLDLCLNAVIGRGDTQLIIDLSALDYISSIGLSTLLSAAKKIKRADGRFVLAAMNDRVAMIMSLSGFDKIFLVAPTVEQALVTMPNGTLSSAQAIAGQPDVH